MAMGKKLRERHTYRGHRLYVLGGAEKLLIVLWLATTVAAGDSCTVKREEGGRCEIVVGGSCSLRLPPSSCAGGLRLALNWTLPSCQRWANITDKRGSVSSTDESSRYLLLNVSDLAGGRVIIECRDGPEAIARVEIQLSQDTGESEPSPELPTALPGSKPPPDNSLTEAPTDPDGRSSAGVVIGVVVGIVVLSLSIAAAVAISWYKLKSQRREEGSCSQAARQACVRQDTPPPPIPQQQENTESTIVHVSQSRPNLPPLAILQYLHSNPALKTVEDTHSENGEEEEQTCFRASEQATREKKTSYGIGSTKRRQVPSKSQSKRDDTSLPQYDATQDSTDEHSSHRPDFSGNTGPAELDIELHETWQLPQSPMT